MKVIELTAPRFDAFRPAAYPDPVPAYGEVLVRLRGASLNFLDLAVATGKYPLSSLPIMARTRPPCHNLTLGATQEKRAIVVRVVFKHRHDIDKALEPAYAPAQRTAPTASKARKRNLLVPNKPARGGADASGPTTNLARMRVRDPCRRFDGNPRSAFFSCQRCSASAA